MPQAVADLTGFGASINSSNYRAQGVETELQVKISSALTARGGYTHLTRVQRSFSSDALAPSFNPLIPGAFRSAHLARWLSTAFPAVSSHRILALHTATANGLGCFRDVVGRRDDSTFSASPMPALATRFCCQTAIWMRHTRSWISRAITDSIATWRYSPPWRTFESKIQRRI